MVERQVAAVGCPKATKADDGRHEPEFEEPFTKFDERLSKGERPGAKLASQDKERLQIQAG